MKQRELEVPDEIKNSIRGFWYRDLDLGLAPAAFEVMPDGHVEIVFHFGNGCNLLQDGQCEPLPSPFIVGLLNKPVYFQGQGRLQIIGIKCLPWAIYNLLEFPMTKGGVQRFTHPLSSLQPKLETLLVSGQIDAALALVRDWCLQQRPSITHELKKAGQAMLSSNGSLPVSSVAIAAHITVRTLERKFKAFTGHTLKEVSGLIRFEQARNKLWENPEISVVSLAHELGYADQSHLTREFKRYSGITAAGFARQIKTH